MRILVTLLFLVIGYSAAAQSQILPNEVRAGLLKHDVGTSLRHRSEKGYDFNAEFLWASPAWTPFEYIFCPRPHMGFSLNNKHGTDQVYAGLTWRMDFVKFLFLEGSFGGEYNTAHKHHASRHKKAIGSHWLFHEAVSLGAQFTDHQSLSLYLDHASSAHLSGKNPGITGFGVRYGYKF